MRKSQICPSCGNELAQVRPFFDHELRLRIVRCPACSHCRVQRRTWSQAEGRTLLRRVSSVTALIFQVAAGVTAMSAACNISALLTDEYLYMSGPGLGVPAEAILFMGVALLLVGVWLSAGLNHWRWHTARWGIFYLIATGLLAFEPLLFPLATEFLHRLDSAAHRSPEPMLPDVFAYRLLFLAGGGAIALIGIPVGHLVLHFDQIFRRARWRWRRRLWRRGSHLT